MKKTEIILKEGYPFIFISGAIFLLSLIFDAPFIIEIILFFIFGFFIYFFRNPERIPEDLGYGAVISPSDGEVIEIVEALSPITKKESLKISIRLSLFDVHIQRAPIEGEIVAKEKIHGMFLSLNDEKASELNEQNRVLFKDEKNEIVVNQIAGFITRRIVDFKDLGPIKIGERYSMIMFGSQVDIYLPKNFTLKVIEFQKVRAGETVLGYINEN